MFFPPIGGTMILTVLLLMAAFSLSLALRNSPSVSGLHRRLLKTEARPSGYLQTESRPVDSEPRVHQQPSRPRRFSPEIVAILTTVYFVQGALGLSRLAMTFFLKDDFHLGPSEIGAISGLFVVPWVIKPLYGFLSECGSKTWNLNLNRSLLSPRGKSGLLLYYCRCQGGGEACRTEYRLSAVGCRLSPGHHYLTLPHRGTG